MNTLRSFIASMALLMATQAFATTLSCNWLNTVDHPEGFYRPSKIVMEIKENEVEFIEDTFLFRTYTPCWVGNHSSCAFGYTYYGKTWTIDSSTEDTINMTAPGAYWSAELTVNFIERKPQEIERSQAIVIKISGDDGDGVWFENEPFLCQKI